MTGKLNWTASVSCLLLATVLLGFPEQCRGQDRQEGDEQQEPKHTNALADETSPYLLAHAHNPVNWYPWNEESLQLARDENKPIFLSIGYSSCHWCHVMEDESFKDEEIAKMMNEHFVCIKVDREERPDLDSIYMTSLESYQVLKQTRGNLGWPLSMFLTPEAKPFFGTTYMPARDGDRGSRTGFMSVLRNVKRIWKEQPETIESDARRVTRMTVGALERAAGDVGDDVVASSVPNSLKGIQQRFDPVFGGFGFSQSGFAPKFPETPKLVLLVDQLTQNPDDEESSAILKTSLDRMTIGGIWDHVGGGFHRYSVDRYWRIPHFEKMLYDNGQLASVYAEASQVFDDQLYRQIARGICDFVLREMVDESGGFYAALDADSEGEEGKFYRWELDELKEVLDEDQYEFVAGIYSLNAEPNFEDEYYALQFKEKLSMTARKAGQTLEEFEQKLSEINARLLASRDKRIRPVTDDKMLVSWNGLMIRGMADTGRILDEAKYTEAAGRAAEFIWQNLRNEDQRLLRTYTRGEAKLNAYLDDYAFLIDGFIALHQATENQLWLDRAVELQAKQDELFWDDREGGYFFTSQDHEKLIARAKEYRDSAMPSGNTVSVGNLMNLYEVTSESSYLEKARATTRSFSGIINSRPHQVPRAIPGIRKMLREN